MSYELEKKIYASLQILVSVYLESYEKGSGNLYYSFTGGKDCLVVYHLGLELIKSDSESRLKTSPFYSTWIKDLIESFKSKITEEWKSLNLVFFDYQEDDEFEEMKVFL